MFVTDGGRKRHQTNHDPAFAKRRSDSAKARATTPEGRAALGRASRVGWDDPVRREAMVAAQTTAQNDPDVSKRKSEALRITNANPEVIERRSKSAVAARARPDVKLKHAEAALRPEVIERRSVAMKEVLNSDETKQKRAATDALPETHDRRSEAAKLTWQNDGVKELRINSQLETNTKPEVKLRRREAQLEVGSRPEVKAKRSASHSSPEVIRKKHETKKRNGSFGKMTAPEKMVQDYLHSIFGPGDVVYQVMVDRWEIDFHIKSIDAYVQQDGEYYHGLDRPIEKIMERKSPTDSVILRTMEIDRLQNEWFSMNDAKLFRIREKDVRASNFSSLAGLLTLKGNS